MRVEDVPRQVIVIGAGLSGAAATASLVAAGFEVTVAEANDRIGGRAFARSFPGESEPLELGGSWIAPSHVRLRRLAEQKGLRLRARHPVVARRCAVDEPRTWHERARHEQAVASVAADATRLKLGFDRNARNEPLRGVSFADYLNRLDAPDFTRAQLSAWWVMSGNGDHALTAASEFLASCAYSDGFYEGMISSWTDTVTPGMDALATRLISDSGATLLLSTPVTEIRHGPGGIVAIAGDRQLAADGCVVALGINQMRRVRFSPELPGNKRDAIAVGHAGRSYKIWAKMKDVTVGTLATGDGHGIEFAFAERSAGDGSTLVVAFGLDADGNHPDDPVWVASELAKLMPGSTLVTHMRHDWVADPYALGTWVAAPAGSEAGLEPGNWRPEDRLAFASSDYAPDLAGWYEGAVLAGELAADHLKKMLQHP